MKSKNLQNGIGLHRSNGHWEDYLSSDRVSLHSEHNGWKLYHHVNEFYIVSPNGDIEVVYGYKAPFRFQKLSEGKE